MNDIMYAVRAGYTTESATLGVFDTPERRDAFLTAALKLHRNAHAIDFPLNPPPPVVVESIMIGMARDYDTTAAADYDAADYEGGLSVDHAPRFRTPSDIGAQYFLKDVCVAVFATADPETAVGLMQAYHAALLAQGLWGDLPAARRVFREMFRSNEVTL
jgi:hypothetical protein